MYKIIQTGSGGNAVLYNNATVLVDCGVAFAKLKPYIGNIQLVLLTHTHKDHLQLNTLLKLQQLRPSIRIGCGAWMQEHIQGLMNIDVYHYNKFYDYGQFKIAIVKLYHDVPNCGYRILLPEYKIFHATDTAHLYGITAHHYDLYAIESNYDEAKAYQAIQQAQAQGTFCHAAGSVKTHLSHRQARDFVNANRKKGSQFLRLHTSHTYG